MANFNLAACMIFRDEAHNLQEWVEYHMMIGVEHFFLYSHLSQDNYREVLQPYIKRRQVTLVEWNFPRRRFAPGGGRGPFPQVTAYDHALERLRGTAKWMMAIDSDEFLTKMSDLSITDFLKRHEGAAAVLLNWAMFGTNGHKTRPEGLVLENYTKRGHKSFDKNHHVKTIIDPTRIKYSLDPHQWQLGCNELGETYKVVDEHGTPVTRETQTEPFLNLSGTPEVSWKYFRINHYAMRSEEEFKWKISQRGRLSSGVRNDEWRDQHFKKQNRNDVEDTHMLKYVSTLKRRIETQNDVTPTWQEVH
tara:strand:- start:15270 stop:16184 length:915 start_codon:yes stop_codon:yes gene_type:complete